MKSKNDNLLTEMQMLKKLFKNIVESTFNINFYFSENGIHKNFDGEKNLLSYKNCVYFFESWYLLL